MADIGSPYHEFINKLRAIAPRQAQLIDATFHTRGQEEFLTEVGAALKQHPDVIPQGHNENSLLNAASGIWQSANPQKEEEKRENKPSVKKASLSDFFPKKIEHAPGGFPQESSFEEDLLKVQKQLALKKLSDAFAKVKSGQVGDVKFIKPILEEVVNGLTLESMLRGQNNLLRSIASNSPFFGNLQKEADKHNLLINLQGAYDNSITQLYSQPFENHEYTVDSDAMLTNLWEPLRDPSNRQFDAVLERVSEVIDHQQAQIRPLMPQITHQIQQSLPQEVFSYFEEIVFHQSRQFTGVFPQTPSGYNYHGTTVRPQFQRLSEGGITPNSQTFSDYSKGHRGRGSRAGRTLLNTAEKVGKKLIKKAGKEGAKQGAKIAILNPHITIPVLLIALGVLVIAIILFLIINFVSSLFSGGSTPSTQALTPTCNPSAQCLTGLKMMGFNVSGDLALNGDPYGKAKSIYEVVALVTQPPSDFGRLLGLPQKQINIVLHSGGGCAGHSSYSGTVDYYGWCNNEIINKFMILHELGHEISFRNPVLYWTKFALPYMVMSFIFRNMPTYNCQLDYGPGPWVAECWADMIGEYVYYPQYRVTVSGRPSGTYNFPSFPNFANSFYYGFARDNIYNGLNFQAPKLPSPTP